MARTYTRGIQEKTQSELVTRTPQEQHERNFGLIPMRGDCLYYVKLRNVEKRLSEGWLLKLQNKLQAQKVELAKDLHKRLDNGSISIIKANKLFSKIASATEENMKEIKEELKK